MGLLIRHWSYDPMLIVIAAIAIVHEVGLQRLNRRSVPLRARRRRRQSLLFYLGLVVLIVAVESPIDYWSDRYFFVHMIQHLLLIFAAPVPIALGAPWLPLQHGLPLAARRRLIRALAIRAWSYPLRRLGSYLRSPWLAVIGLNAVVLLWHVPGPFDLAERDQTIHIWLMHGSFFGFGLLFWLQLINSHPLRVRLSPIAQMGSVFATAVTFWVLGMALSIFSSGSWYPWYVAHEGPMLAPFADQQIAAGIMWTSGIFWALPAFTVATRRLMDQRGDEGVEAALDALLRGRKRVRSPGRVHAELALRDARLEDGG